MSPVLRAAEPVRDNGLDAVLRPSSVAIVGASYDPKKRGYQAIEALRESGYRGEIYPVNPRGGELLGLKVSPTVAEIEGSPELALVCTPAATVPRVLAECAAKGIRGAVVLALGFREIGEEGEELEAQVREAARRTGIRVVGPNTSGVLNLGIGLNLIGARGLRRGHVALVVQSGNMLLGLMTEAMATCREGLSICVGVGNQTDIRFHEYLDYLDSDPDTRVVVLYVEGFEDGRAFLETASRVTRYKPVVLLKGGRSEAGHAAARSHTGVLTTEYATVRAALRQAGVIEIERSDELFPVAETLARQPAVSAGTALAILSDGGGHATLAADALSAHGIPLARLAAETRARLRELLGSTAAVANPIDLAGAADRDPSVFARTLRTLAADPAVGGVLMVGLFGGYAIRFAAELAEAELETARELAAIMMDQGKPLVVHTLFAAAGSPPLAALGDASVPVLGSLEVACRCIAATYERGTVEARRPAPPPPAVAPSPGTLANAVRERRLTLLETEARALLEHFGVPFPPAMFVRSAEDAARATAELGAPVALKVVSSSISHKTEAGGVILGIEGASAAAAAYRSIRESVEAYAAARNLDAGVQGVLVGPMQPAPLQELLIGVRRDPQFGPVVTVGAGGIGVEVLADVAIRMLPLREADATAMLDELRTSPLLDGFRGRPPADKQALVRIIQALATCVDAHPEIVEIEVNPVFAFADRAVAVDVRAFIDPDAAAPLRTIPRGREPAASRSL